MKILLINGAARTGKTTFTKYAKSLIPQCSAYACSTPLKNAVNAFFNIGTDVAGLMALAKYPDERFKRELEVTYRQAQIDLFQKWAKEYRNDILGVIAASRIRGLLSRVVLVDCGMIDEAKVIQEAFGYNNVALVTIKRDGFEWGQDYREDLSTHQFFTQEVIHNKYDLELYETQIRKLLTKWELISND